MWQKILTRVVARLLRSSRLSFENRTILVTALLDELNFLPSRAILELDEQGRILVEGEPLEIEQAISIREGAKALLNSPTYRLIRNQVAFQAVTIGVHTGDTPERMYFSKVVLWWGMEIEKLIRLLAQE